jgi:two-component system nitrogen regulation sensor histidine kinase GlnL
VLEKLYKQLLDNLSTAVLLLDSERCLRYMNPAAEALFEISASRAEGQLVLGLIKEVGDFHQVLEETVSSGRPFTKREASLQLYNGKALIADYSLAPLQDEISGLVIVEIQPRDRLIRIGREEEGRAKQAATRELVRGLAHEIKNPLGGIRGAAQLLSRALPDDSLQDYTDVIIGEADRLQKLVDRMLGPRKLPQLKPLNIHRVLERVYHLVSAETRGAVRLVRDYDPSIPDVECDEEQLIQAFLNVVRNAVQALLESHTAEPEITIRSRTLRQFTLGTHRYRLVCLVEVSDNGPGIPLVLMETLFYPMISGRAEGSGLGLSIAQSIVSQHQGLIECRSEPGKTDFMIYIPLERENEQRG